MLGVIKYSHPQRKRLIHSNVECKGWSHPGQRDQLKSRHFKKRLQSLPEENKNPLFNAARDNDFSDLLHLGNLGRIPAKDCFGLLQNSFRRSVR